MQQNSIFAESTNIKWACLECLTPEPLVNLESEHNEFECRGGGL